MKEGSMYIANKKIVLHVEYKQKALYSTIASHSWHPVIAFGLSSMHSRIPIDVIEVYECMATMLCSHILNKFMDQIVRQEIISSNNYFIFSRMGYVPVDFIRDGPQDNCEIL